MESFISQQEKNPEIGKYFSPKSTPENTHGLSQKIQGTYFKISALYFKIYGLYFSPFQITENQQRRKEARNGVKSARRAFFFSRFAAPCSGQCLTLFRCHRLRATTHGIFLRVSMNCPPKRSRKNQLPRVCRNQYSQHRV